MALGRDWVAWRALYLPCRIRSAGWRKIGAEKSTSRRPEAGEGSTEDPEGGGGTSSAGKGSVKEVMAVWCEMLAGGSSPRMEHA